MISVKLVELGSEIKEYSLNDGSTLQDLLNVANERYVEGAITRNNQPILPYANLYNGDRIFLGRATKGNLDPFEVNFIRIGGSTVHLAAEDGYTIKQTLEQLDGEERTKFFRADGKAAYEFRVGGGQPVEMSYVLSRPPAGTAIRVICSQRVKGNLS